MSTWSTSSFISTSPSIWYANRISLSCSISYSVKIRRATITLFCDRNTCRSKTLNRWPLLVYTLSLLVYVIVFFLETERASASFISPYQKYNFTLLYHCQQRHFSIWTPSSGHCLPLSRISDYASTCHINWSICHPQQTRLPIARNERSFSDLAYQ
jgi:hypothetical protein